MSMNEWLAQVYGTNGASGSDDLEKTAQAMMLQKMAEQEGIDLSGLTEEQLAALAEQVVSQDSAGDQQPQAPAPAMDNSGYTADDVEKLANLRALELLRQAGYQIEGDPAPAAAPQQSVAEEQEKLAQAKFAEADFLGRVMAHAFNQEITKIASEGGQVAPQPQRGPVASAIHALGGSVQEPQPQQPVQAPAQAAPYVEKLAQLRALEMLREAGYEV
jgi:hypothetical protein